MFDMTHSTFGIPLWGWGIICFGLCYLMARIGGRTKRTDHREAVAARTALMERRSQELNK